MLLGTHHSYRSLLLKAVCLLLVHGLARTGAKVFSGIISSKDAWKNKGTFITKFCFHDRKALFHYEVNATGEGARWYFYLDEHWKEAISETDCELKRAKARFSVNIGNKEGEQIVNQWMRPHFWYVVFGDSNSCKEDSPTDQEDYTIGYTLNFLNPDSQGVANDHFGEDQKGLLSMYALVIILYIGGISIFIRSVWQTIQKGGPMHEVLQMLCVAIGMHLMAALFMLIHLWIYKNDGEGSKFFEAFSEVLDVLAQLVMTWMLLWISLGWTMGGVSTHPVNDKQQLGLLIGVSTIEAVLVVWEQSYDESHYTYHPHESLPGFLLVLLRIGLAILFGYNLRERMQSERSVMKRNFYRTFSIACYSWFLAFPVLMVIAMVFAEYWRHRVVTIGTILIQSVAMLWLSKQFLSRSLYWEVSSLSSTTLPLKRERGFGGGGIAGMMAHHRSH